MYEYDIKKTFVEEFNKMIQNKDEIIADCEIILYQLLDTSEIEREHDGFVQEGEVVAKLIEKLVMDNAKAAMNQDEYSKKQEKDQSRLYKSCISQGDAWNRAAVQCGQWQL